MDISKLDVVALSEKGYTFKVVNPKTAAVTDIEITVRGSYAEGYRDEADVADTIPKTAALLAKYTVGWKGLEENGTPVEFSVKEAERIYVKYPLIRGQVHAAISDVRNFIAD